MSHFYLKKRKIFSVLLIFWRNYINFLSFINYEIFNHKFLDDFVKNAEIMSIFFILILNLKHFNNFFYFFPTSSRFRVERTLRITWEQRKHCHEECIQIGIRIQWVSK